ncbi:ABC transporter permease [Streptomyces sp. TRM 70361]|nr:ABC transporter permease [Streptomyces sp. TRM 70361]MEE1939242.1 ABC transporter permease [Streptomyces sp. TRM 70361]
MRRGSRRPLAAFVVFGTVMTQQILSATAVERFRGTPEAVSAVLTSDAPEGIGDAELRRIGELPGVAEAVGRHDDGAPLGGSSVERYLQLYADPGTGPLSQVRLLRGAFPDGPDRIAVNEQAARDYGLAPGSPLILLRVDPGDPDRTLPTEVEVSGVVRSAVTGQKQPAGYATDLRIRRLLGFPGHPRVDIRTESGTVTDGLREDIGRVVPSAELHDGTAVRAAEEKEAAASAGDLLELVSLFLAVAVVASALVAAYTFRIVFAQRVRQLALLRAVGATGRQLRRALLAEGAAVGLAAGLVGVVAAWGCAHLVPLVSGRFGQPLSPAAGFPLTAAVLTVAGTALLAVLAVLAPSLSAARVSPMQALRAAEYTNGTRAASAGRVLAGLLGAAGAAALARHQRGLLPETEGDDIDRFSALLVITVSGTLALLALSALGPVLVRPVLAALSPPLRRLGTAGRLAVTSVGEAPRRAAAGMLVVALGSSLICVTLVCLDSLRAYDQARQAVEAPADYILQRDDGAPLPGLASEVKARPELTGVQAFRSVDVVSGTRSATLTDLDPHRLGIASGLPTATGTLGTPRAGHAVVDAQYAQALGVRAGDRISVRYQERTTTFTVAATLRGSGPYHASIYVPAADLTRMGVDTAPTTITADAAEDGPPGQVTGRQRPHRPPGGPGGPPRSRPRPRPRRAAGLLQRPADGRDDGDTRAGADRDRRRRRGLRHRLPQRGGTHPRVRPAARPGPHRGLGTPHRHGGVRDPRGARRRTRPGTRPALLVAGGAHDRGDRAVQPPHGPPRAGGLRPRPPHCRRGHGARGPRVPHPARDGGRAEPVTRRRDPAARPPGPQGPGGLVCSPAVRRASAPSPPAFRTATDPGRSRVRTAVPRS